MQTTRLSAVEEPVVRASQDTGKRCEVYESVQLLTDDPAKLMPLIDQMLFYIRAARLKTRPVAIREVEGVISIWWSRYAPAVFRERRLLDVIASGECIDNFTIQESVRAS
jgi:hypothetical protein